ncbi:nucleoside recognition domain-containing protein [Pelosinus sp. sgz500959]|uniref:nucleoside recognition domain-containing protein n=1 Tax=Pelosinus sp. sgz500959 TaxID=3242472 RepID=UPI00366DE39F
MINIIWLLLLVISIVHAALQGKIDVITQSAISGAEGAVALSLQLIGVMCLWLGIMKIAELAGIIQFVSRVINPVICFLFPSVPRNHPAMGAIIMTLSANLLGLGNAVTPLGIKAMQALQQLNPKKDTASDAMCTLLGLCTAGFTLIPATMIAIRSAAGSENPTEIVGSTLLVSFMATVSVVIADRICRMVYSVRIRR